MSLHAIVYVSSATRKLTPDQLDALVNSAARFNEAHGITGMLLHRDGDFMQAIEGEADTVQSLYDRIRRDRRHQNVITIVDEPVEAREFSEWSMGFENLDRHAYNRSANAAEARHIAEMVRTASTGTDNRKRRLLAGFFERALG